MRCFGVTIQSLPLDVSLTFCLRPPPPTPLLSRFRIWHDVTSPSHVVIVRRNKEGRKEQATSWTNCASLPVYDLPAVQKGNRCLPDARRITRWVNFTIKVVCYLTA